MIHLRDEFAEKVGELDEELTLALTEIKRLKNANKKMVAEVCDHHLCMCDDHLYYIYACCVGMRLLCPFCTSYIPIILEHDINIIMNISTE